MAASRKDNADSSSAKREANHENKPSNATNSQTNDGTQNQPSQKANNELELFDDYFKRLWSSCVKSAASLDGDDMNQWRVVAYVAGTKAKGLGKHLAFQASTKLDSESGDEAHTNSTLKLRTDVPPSNAAAAEESTNTSLTPDGGPYQITWPANGFAVVKDSSILVQQGVADDPINRPANGSTVVQDSSKAAQDDATPLGYPYTITWPANGVADLHAETPLSSESSGPSWSAWCNVQAWMAKLTDTGTMDFSDNCLMTFREALETPQALESPTVLSGTQTAQPSMEDMLSAVVYWIKYSPTVIYAGLRQKISTADATATKANALGQLTLDAGVSQPGFWLARYQFWISRLAQLSKLETAAGKPTQLASIALLGYMYLTSWPYPTGDALANLSVESDDV